jgi:mono/diheme cytochrome c family protein
VAAPTVAAVSPSAPAFSAPVATPVPTVIPAPIGPVAPAANLFTPVDPNIIKWDAETKEHSAKLGDAEAKFTFWLTNVSPSEVLVNSVRTSCGCTVAKLPSQPWHIPSGSNGPIDVTMNLAGKSGMISKGVTVETSAGIKQLTVKCNIPVNAPGSLPVQQSGTMGDADRLKNMQLAMADRQVVFKNQECAKCHAEPAKNKTDGRILYAGVCATCHNSQHRAAAVPDLRLLKHPTDADYWRQWTAHGRPGSMMPAYAESEGGPLNEQQINALVDFMMKAFPSRAASLE